MISQSDSESIRLRKKQQTGKTLVQFRYCLLYYDTKNEFSNHTTLLIPDGIYSKFNFEDFS